MSLQVNSTRRVSSKAQSTLGSGCVLSDCRYISPSAQAIAYLVDALFTKYGRKFVNLEVIATDFLGLSDQNTIIRLAWRNDLCGIKAFKLRDGVKGHGKGQWLVDIEQLADALYWMPSESLNASEGATAMLNAARSDIAGGEK